MSLAATVTQLLSERLGLSPELLGFVVVERALDSVLGKAGLQDRGERIAHLLQGKGEEWDTLVDEIIVPETWFFRGREPFRLLACYVKEKWRPANPTGPFQALCIPCASGEEPYSVAMTALDAGLEADRIRIDAGDVSGRALAQARRAVYGRSSFREKHGLQEEKYLLPCSDGRRVRDEVAALVRFENANLLDLSVYRQRAPYHVVFCRNAVIYLEERARREVMAGLRELLHEDGLLFTGHSELMPFLEAGFRQVDYPLSFACRKGGPGSSPTRAAPKGGATPPETEGVRPRRESPTLTAISQTRRKGGALAPPFQDPQVIPMSRGPHSPSADGLCGPRDGSVREAAPAAGLKPRPSASLAQNGRAREKSGPKDGATPIPPGLEQAGQLADRGELEAATAICERLLAEGTQDPAVYSLLGVINESGGKLEIAEELFRKALFLDPHHYQSLVYMSLLCERRGDIDDSRLYRARAGRVLSQRKGDRAA
jgi:chemotaxis protein methyltransferase WspC